MEIIIAALGTLLFYLLIIFGIVSFIRGIKSSYKKSTDDEVQPNVHFIYRRKPFFMTKNENQFFDALITAVDGKYYVFPQVHLSTILDHKVSGQTWEYALRYINQKSVDYVICDKKYRRPLVAIELDDWSHDSKERVQRDVNVEYMLKQAGIPLRRFRYSTDPTEEEVVEKVKVALGPVLSSIGPDTDPSGIE